MNFKIFTYVILWAVLVSAACQKRATVVDYSPNKTKVLFEEAYAKQLTYNSLISKLAIRSQEGEKTMSFKVNLRLRSDSAVWMSISKGAEGFRTSFTNDSLVFMNRLKKEAYTGNTGEFKGMLDYDINLDLLQNLLTGGIVREFEINEFRSSLVDGKYLMSTMPRRALSKIVETRVCPDQSFQAFWFDEKTMRMTKVVYFDQLTGRYFEAEYLNYRKVEGLLHPGEIIVRFESQEKKFQLNINVNRFVLDKAVKMPMKIPRRYEILDKLQF